VALVIPAWSELPHPLAGIAWLNVAFHGRYALVALVLAGAILAEMVAAHGKRRPLRSRLFMSAFRRKPYLA
jgi:hypothetical protein